MLLDSTKNDRITNVILSPKNINEFQEKNKKKVLAIIAVKVYPLLSKVNILDKMTERLG